MNLLHLIIATPDGNIFDGNAVSISVRGSEGELAIMANHIPFVTSVKPCKCRITFEDGTIKEGETDGGLLTVSEERTTLLSSSFRF